MNNKNEVINSLAKAITGYCFRNGIVQEYHAAGCLNDEQMKALNKYMVDRMGFLLLLQLEGRFEDATKILSKHAQKCGNWDDVDISGPAEELKKLYENALR